MGCLLHPILSHTSVGSPPILSKPRESRHLVFWGHQCCIPYASSCILRIPSVLAPNIDAMVFWDRHSDWASHYMDEVASWTTSTCKSHAESHPARISLPPSQSIRSSRILQWTSFKVFSVQVLRNSSIPTQTLFFPLTSSGHYPSTSMEQEQLLGPNQERHRSRLFQDANGKYVKVFSTNKQVLYFRRKTHSRSLPHLHA